MCTTDIYPSVLADGSRTETRETHRCSAARRNQPCEPVIFRHPTAYHAHPPPSPYLYPQMYNSPPSPSQRHASPRTGTPLYRSGDESEQSARSASSAASRESRSRRRNRDSGVFMPSSPSSNGHRHSPSPGKNMPQRIVIVDSPPTPRTPPQTFLAPHTAPSSPNFSSHRRAFSASTQPQFSPSRDSLRPQPVIVDERPRPHIRTAHKTHHSSSEDRPKRPKQSRDAERERSLQERIRAANSSIAQRGAIPIPRKPTVSFAPSLEQEKDLREALERMRIAEESREREREGRRKEVDEEIAQRERLRERMMPRRRATVGPGSRRGKIVYEDGMYQWE